MAMDPQHLEKLIDDPLAAQKKKRKREKETGQQIPATTLASLLGGLDLPPGALQNADPLALLASPAAAASAHAAAQGGSDHASSSSSTAKVDDDDAEHLEVPTTAFLKEVLLALIDLQDEDENPKANWEYKEGRVIRVHARPVSGDNTTIASRTYAGRRIKQVCRWISTTVYALLEQRGVPEENIEEVQATVWPPDNPATARFYISANKPKALERMRKWFPAASTAHADLTGLQGALSEKSESKVDALGMGQRVNRHPAQLGEWLAAPDPKDGPDRLAWEALRGALDRPVVVASGVDRKADTHAEVRIHETIRAEEKAVDPTREVTLDAENVGGLKRPCVFCYLALYSHQDPTVVHPGPLWLTGNAAVPAAAWGKPEDVAKLIYENVPATYLSPILAKVPSSAYGYDSESSTAESKRKPPSGKKKKKRRKARG